ncbi:MAG: hypothetical protein P8J50_17495 [Acidimicrobiales bacterium]|nr:hypothetical protein [Acidimicrobiales bacterium]
MESDGILVRHTDMIQKLKMLRVRNSWPAAMLIGLAVVLFAAACGDGDSELNEEPSEICVAVTPECDDTPEKPAEDSGAEAPASICAEGTPDCNDALDPDADTDTEGPLSICEEGTPDCNDVLDADAEGPASICAEGTPDCNDAFEAESSGE